MTNFCGTGNDGMIFVPEPKVAYSTLELIGGVEYHHKAGAALYFYLRLINFKESRKLEGVS